MVFFVAAATVDTARGAVVGLGTVAAGGATGADIGAVAATGTVVLVAALLTECLCFLRCFFRVMFNLNKALLQRGDKGGQKYFADQQGFLMQEKYRSPAPRRFISEG